ncbi:uncharacterized protein, partial [Miscanthus floridulus]|uniref:uncharacterized protein n=1 Tax=Miscanthus floridulus TaxID=154761 RepID=UPI00345944FB
MAGMTATARGSMGGRNGARIDGRSSRHLPLLPPPPSLSSSSSSSPSLSSSSSSPSLSSSCSSPSPSAGRPQGTAGPVELGAGGGAWGRGSSGRLGASRVAIPGELGARGADELGEVAEDSGRGSVATGAGREHWLGAGASAARTGAGGGGAGRGHRGGPGKTSPKGDDGGGGGGAAGKCGGGWER